MNLQSFIPRTVVILGATAALFLLLSVPVFTKA